MKNKKISKGFTLVEIILYIAILGIIITVITNFSLDSLQEKNNQQSKQIVKQDADFVLDKITHEIENATKINRFESIFGNTIPAGKIVLNKKNGTVVTISLSGSNVYYQEDLNPPEIISSPNTKISTLNFLANVTDGNIPKEVQVKLHAESVGEGLISVYAENFQISIVPKNADIDEDGCLDVVDQYPLDPTCCRDTDGDNLCDASDNCPLIHNMDQRDDDADGIGFACDDEVDTGEGGGSIVGGTWNGTSSIDSCIYTCNYSHNLWQTICQKFECFYTGNKNNFETDTDNDEYAGVGQIFSMEAESMYWKKTFKLEVPSESIPKIDRFSIHMNYCHAGSRLKSWWRKARCSGEGYHINGYFVDDQDLELFNYALNTWDTINKLETHLTNNDEIYATYEYSNNLQNYININNEVTIRAKFKADGAPWGDPQRWNLLVPSRYLFIDYFNLEIHIQGVATCGDKLVEMDEQCDDGSFCNDGTDCTGTGSTVCSGIGDEECRPRDGIGNNCSALCLNENAVCGNTLIEVGEECDDGNLNDGDGCNSSCEVETCGNKILEAPEECDTGTRCENSAFCNINADCTGIGNEKCLMRNGDLKLDGFPDACSEFCLDEICGNNRLDYGEQCDDGNLIDGDGCNSICRLEFCPNDNLDTGEECDDNNSIDDDDCNNSCQIQECGDGIKNRSVEECDDGKQCGDALQTGCTEDSDCVGIGDNTCKTRNIDGCSSICLIEFAVCGNSALEFGEDCDDSNLNDGDGCSHTCMTEYTATYDFSNHLFNGQGLKREGWVVGSNTQPPNKGPDDLFATIGYGAPKPYQVEFMNLDDLIPQAPGTIYNKIKTEDNTYYVANFTEDRYLDHKFDFLIDENEYRSDEISPKRIESITVNWNGFAELSGFLGLNDRIVTLYAWKKNEWEPIASKEWQGFGWDKSDKTITATLTNNIGDYIDSNRKLHIIVGVDEQGVNMVNTDFIEVKIKAYPYRIGYE